MSQCQRFFCCQGGKFEHPASGRASVPQELTRALAGHLKFASAATGMFWMAYLALMKTQQELSLAVLWTGSLAVVASVLLAGLAQHGRLGTNRLSQLGTGYLMLVSLALALTTLSSEPRPLRIDTVSYSAVWIALFPLLVPSSPKKTLMRAILAASLNPLVFFAGARLSHSPRLGLSAADSIAVFAPVYLAVVVAFLAAHLLSRLSSKLESARDIGAYRLDSLLAEGGMGEVWSARHRLLTRPAAIKLVKGTPKGRGTMDSVKRQRFEREAQVTAALKSPHVVQLYDFGVTKTGTFYYVMELLDGVNLQELVEREGPIEPKRVVHILKQALDSLAEAHAHGLVHRDIKPANIQLSRRGLQDDFVKILDFGLVKSKSGNGSKVELTQQNQINGTPGYLAPELITGEGSVDGRADLYSLGCVAYWLLTGKLVFEGSTAMQLAIAHATEDPVPPSQRLGREVPSALEELVMACLRKDPTKRPRSALSVLAALERMTFTDTAPDRSAVLLSPPVLLN